MKKSVSIVFLLAVSVLAWGQATTAHLGRPAARGEAVASEPAAALDRSAGQSLHADCANPIELTPGQVYVYEKSPRGAGNTQEFKGNEGIPHLFPAEINTVWYSFRAPVDGLIIFEVRPFRVLDDYDWMLFKQGAAASCDSISEYGVKPVRSNRARNDLRINSKTGLHSDYTNLHAPPGPGKSYSKPLAVKRGETYLLVLDNIYPGGEGHHIIVRYANHKAHPFVTIKGRVVEQLTGKPLAAKVYAEEDSSGYSLLKTLVDSARAAFTFNVPAGTPVHLSALKKDYLLTTLNFTAGTRDTSLVLPLEPADKGSSMILFNIRFFPNKAEFQPNAFPELARLLEFMQQSAGKYIRITGHTNSNVFANKSWLLDLSVYRAAAVRDYLISHGIEANRIRIAGAGGSHPLTKSNDMKEAMKNLRVEIELLN